MQLVRQGVDVLAEQREALANGAHRLGLRVVRRGELGAPDVDRQHGEPLGHVVVEFAREQRALLLLGADQAPAQVAQFLLGLLLLGDLTQDAGRGGDAAGGITTGRASQMVQPLLPRRGVQVPILHGDLVHQPLVQLTTFSLDGLTVVRMQVLHPEFDAPQALILIGRQAT